MNSRAVAVLPTPTATVQRAREEHGVKILVVEDDPVLARTTGRILRGAGYEIVTAGDAVAAISTARNELPDLVVLDLGLPAGSGVLVLQRLRALTQTSLTPVVVVTGGASPDQAAELDQLGIEALLMKPVQPDELLQAVAGALDE